MTMSPALRIFLSLGIVANHVIDRNAGGWRGRASCPEGSSETSGNAALNVDGVVVSKTIEFARGNAGFDERREVVEKFGGKAAGKGIAVAASGKVLALCGRVLSVLPLKLDNKR